MEELIGTVFLLTIGLAVGAVWVTIKILVWLAKCAGELTNAIVQAITTAIEKERRERARQRAEALKPHMIRATAQEARDQMSEITDQFVLETEQFLKGG